MRLKATRKWPEDIGIDKVNKPMEILGIYFTYNWQKFQELNFENIIKSIQKSINAWRWKNLDSHNSTWKIFLDSYLADFGSSFVIKCNYDVRFLPKTLPKFYKECLRLPGTFRGVFRGVSRPSDVARPV